MLKILRQKRIQIALLILSAAAISAVGISKTIKNSSSVQAVSDKAQTLRIELFERNDYVNNLSNIDSGALTDWVQEHFGDPNGITIEFVRVPRENETSDLNKYIAAGDGPDILLTYNPYYFGSYAKSGYLTDLSELIDTKGEHIKSFIGDEILRSGRIDGKQYAIPAKRMFNGKYVSYIRKDWLDRLGLKVPGTTEELLYTLMQFRDKDPGRLGADKLVPFSSQSGNSAAVKTILQNFCMDNPDSETKYFADPDYKQGLKFLNKLYNENILGNSYSSDNASVAHYANIAEGNVGFFMDGISNISFRRLINVYELMKHNDPDAEYVACDAISSKSGNHFKEINSDYGIYIFVPSYSDKAELAVKYLDWMSQPEVLEVLQSGNFNTGNNGFFDLSIVINGFYAETREKSLETEAASYGDYAELFLDACRISINDGFNQDLPPEETIQNGNSDRTAKLIDKYVTLCISTSPDNFETVYEQAAAQFNEEINQISP